jgi:minor extracellular serine protease Vpr
VHVPVNGNGRRRLRMATYGALALVALAVAAVATADDGDNAVPTSRFERIDPATIGLNEGSGTKFVPASMSDKPVSVVLKMSGSPVAVAEANARQQGTKLSAAQKAAIRADLKARQDSISKDVAQAGATIISQMQDAYNGILVHAAQKDLPALAAIPGVTDIQPVGLYSVPTNVNGVPLIGAPAAWGASTSLTGQGVKVGVIDTGIDFTHADFGGPGTAAAYTAAHAASTVAANPAYFGPAAPKVKGGFDFVGDDYAAGTANSTPHPDPNPLDCNGHGTHVSGTAVGFGVTSAGATYAGPYNATTVSGNAWLVGPGVAPKADLYMYRVFGCTGSTDIVIAAINKAVEDGVDVINMSLGSPFGTSDQSNAELTAVNNAVAAGVTVVASAGNAGQNAYIVGAPSTANHALSVAASDGSVPIYPAGLFHLTAASSIVGINANGATFADGFSGTVRVLRDSTGGVSLGCDPAEYNGSTGKIVVVQRGVCARVARAIFGQKAGAAAVVMINNSTALPPFEGPITSNPDTGEQYTVTIPFFGVRGTVASGADAAKLIAADGTTITIDNTTTPNTGYKASASFTSGGPRQGDSAAKPEITAPGVSVTSALVGGGTAGTVLSGTSMAAPMTSGTAALVQQAHPTWNGDQIKAALVNTADASQITNYNGRINGSGFLQAAKATDTNAIAWTADGLDSLSYGYAAGTGDWNATKSFTVTNTGGSPISYNVNITQPTAATLSASPSAFTVPAGGSQTVDVTAAITAAQFAALPSASTFVTGIGQVTTRRGAVTATPTTSGPGIQALRVPALIAPRGLSSVSASAPASYARQGVGNVYTSSTTVTNTGIHSGTADVYAWGVHDANDLGTRGQDVRDAGVQQFDDGTLVFAVNGYNQSSTQATQEYDVAIDLQHDGKPDYFVVGVDLGAVLTGSFDGRFGSFTINAKTGAIVDAFVADAPMNGSTALLPTTVEDLGLRAPATTDFRYWVNGFSVFGGSVDTTPTGAYDVAKPGVSTGQFASLAPGASAPIGLTVDYDQAQRLQELGWLVANVDDAAGAAQADEVPFGSIKK